MDTPYETLILLKLCVCVCVCCISVQSNQYLYLKWRQFWFFFLHVQQGFRSAGFFILVGISLPILQRLPSYTENTVLS